MISDLNMLGWIMKNLIFREFDTTINIIVNHIWIHLLAKQANHDLPHLDGLTFFLIRSYILSLYRNECNRSLFPTVPRNSH